MSGIRASGSAGCREICIRRHGTEKSSAGSQFRKRSEFCFREKILEMRQMSADGAARLRRSAAPSAEGLARRAVEVPE